MNIDIPQNIRQMKNGSWYWMDKAIIRSYMPKIGAIGIAVYNYLACLADIRQTCFPSHGHIAKVLGCSRTTVIKALKALVTCRLVSIDRAGRYPQLFRLLAVSCPETGTELSNNQHPTCSQTEHKQ